MFNFRRRETPWEVVENKMIDPVPTYYDDEVLDIASVGVVDASGKYVFDVKDKGKEVDLRGAVVFARKQLLQQIAQNGYNALLRESWQVTVYRRAKRHRVEVLYYGRPAHVLGKVSKTRPPPFMAMLQAPH